MEGEKEKRGNGMGNRERERWLGGERDKSGGCGVHQVGRFDREFRWVRAIIKSVLGQH